MTPEQAAQRYKWIKFDPKTQTVELYLDNYMLSNSRTCEASFYLEHLIWIEPRYADSVPRQDGKVVRKPWFLDFGEYIHWCLEQYYRHIKQFNQPPNITEWLDICKMKWAVMKMDDYANSVASGDVTKYNDVKGWEGVAGLLAQYYAYYWSMRLRIIDMEIVFGYGKEVFIGEFYTYDIHGEPDLHVMCYLTGRIDLLVDNGNKIGPVDHKTTHRFDGFEHEDFNPHDGICGYILAMHDILARYKEQGLTQVPQCNGGWIYHISACSPSTPRDKSKSPMARFKTTPIDKNSEQLEDYKARQLSTFRRIVSLVFEDKTPEWNTTQCNNMFFRKCKYKPIHEQPSSQWTQIISQFYKIGEPWDTRNHINDTVKTEGKPEEEKGNK